MADRRYCAACAASNWLGGWTLLYWGWWLSWSPFVGMFIA
ncbi:BCCT family transporter, partial [Serratia sp. IR-2025]